MSTVPRLPVVPRAAPLAAGVEAGIPARLRRPAPPLASLSERRERRLVYACSTLDRGRVVDRALFHALGWEPGTRLDIRESQGLLIVYPDPKGVFKTSKRDRLLLPYAARQWCRLLTGDRVLLVADPEAGCLFVHPPAGMDAMVTTAHRAALGGDGS